MKSVRNWVLGSALAIGSAISLSACSSPSPQAQAKSLAAQACGSMMWRTQGVVTAVSGPWENNQLASNYGEALSILRKGTLEVGKAASLDSKWEPLITAWRAWVGMYEGDVVNMGASTPLDTSHYTAEQWAHYEKLSSMPAVHVNDHLLNLCQEALAR